MSEWTPSYFDVNPFAECFSYVTYGQLISTEEAAVPMKVRLASWVEWRDVLDKNKDDGGADVTMGLTSKVAALLGYGWLLAVPDYDPAFYADERGSCPRAATLLWVKASSLSA